MSKHIKIKHSGNKHLRFTGAIFEVINTRQGYILGYIDFHHRWEQWVFTPESKTIVLLQNHLNIIRKKIIELNERWRYESDNE